MIEFVWDWLVSTIRNRKRRKDDSDKAADFFAEDARETAERIAKDPLLHEIEEDRKRLRACRKDYSFDKFVYDRINRLLSRGDTVYIYDHSQYEKDEDDDPDYVWTPVVWADVSIELDKWAWWNPLRFLPDRWSKGRYWVLDVLHKHDEYVEQHREDVLAFINENDDPTLTPHLLCDFVQQWFKKTFHADVQVKWKDYDGNILDNENSVEKFIKSNDPADRLEKI